MGVSSTAPERHPESPRLLSGRGAKVAEKAEVDENVGLGDHHHHESHVTRETRSKLDQVVPVAV